MADDETTVDETEVDGDGAGPEDGEVEDKRPDDTLAENKTCPECDAPVDDVRATCINCGYEYKEEDHEDLEAGSEFTSGSQIDEDGNELPDEELDPSGDDSETPEEESKEKPES